MLELILAIAHHVLVFGLVSMMMMSLGMLTVRPFPVIRLARLDAGAGALSAVVLAVGLARAIWGGKGWAFYAENPFFWGKIGCFVLIGLLTIPGTAALAKWSKATAADPAFQPDAAQAGRMRAMMGVQILVLIALLACAAAMARWPF